MRKPGLTSYSPATHSEKHARHIFLADHSHCDSAEVQVASTSPCRTHLYQHVAEGSLAGSGWPAQQQRRLHGRRLATSGLLRVPCRHARYDTWALRVHNAIYFSKLGIKAP